MSRLLLLPIAMCLAFQVNASCRLDTLEVGDIGPDDTNVCALFKSIDPDSEVRIVNRYILAADRVSVAVVRDGRPLHLEYRLLGFQWRLRDNNLVTNQ